ncbi:hypothetical protein FOA43_002053 [Brettanomyces nanus]|uniref:RNA helicase n=1 Tax=Eeniella nana TaxID=13502 RepID=A0A875RP86_EENNA|nr:uncharacterized protein FOA43_002053 [Brettanomyces nanus]QPG74720.1 hypothetical protein FOA43_002053 [Brettanomyces nanus]
MSNRFKRRKKDDDRSEWTVEDVKEETKIQSEDIEKELQSEDIEKELLSEDVEKKLLSEDVEKELLYGNNISLETGTDRKEEQEDVDFSELRKVARQRYLTDREKKQMILLESELKDYERDIEKIGWDNLSGKERKEYSLKKQVMTIFNRRRKIEEEELTGHGEGFQIQNDYITSEGRIDTKRKRQALYGRREGGIGYEVKEMTAEKQITGFTHLKDESHKIPEKKYEYVFDKSQKVEFSMDGDDEEIEDAEKFRLEAKIAQEEARVKSIEQTRKSLPVYKYRNQLIDAVKKYPVLIVVGETGSGKTTQLPQYLYEAGFAKGLRIGCTQPRRVAATAVAVRVADEVGTKLGDRVGYSVRFDDKTTDKTVIKYMTDGMLLREFMSDPDLSGYSVMMVDEAHERTLHTDILLGLLKEISTQRADFRLLISSATMDAEKFSAYFNDAPIFNIPGRRFPVAIHYTMQPEANYLHAATTTVFQIHLSQGPGDILVFLTGQDEIETMATNLRNTAEKLAGQMPLELIVCPIYANLPPEKQKLIFAPTPKKSRKVVLATNIAETSLTINGIAYVVDSGFVKEDIYSPATGMQALTVVPCSHASADQRAGRAGRTGPGKCFRLYTKWAFSHEMPASSTPEILRANLSGVVLQMMSLGISDLIHFDFLDAPAPEALIKALEQLYALGALNEKGELTRVGRMMADLPCDPMLAKCLITGGDLKCCKEVISVVAMLEESGALFYKGAEEAANSVEKFRSRSKAKLGGDHLTLLEIWQEFVEAGFSVQWCRDNYLQYRSLNRARNVRNQLEKLCRRLGLEEGEEESGKIEDEDDKDRKRIRVMKSITSGFFSNAAKLSRSGESYQTLKKHQSVWIHPSSALFKMKPPVRLVIYNELVLTSKEFMRNCMPITEKWLKEYAPHYYGRSRE